jgi:hypothetical protein
MQLTLLFSSVGFVGNICTIVCVFFATFVVVIWHNIRKFEFWLIKIKLTLLLLGVGVACHVRTLIILIIDAIIIRFCTFVAAICHEFSECGILTI